MKKRWVWASLLCLTLPSLFSCSPLSREENSSQDGGIIQDESRPDTVVDEVNWLEQQRVIPADVAQAIKESGMPIYEGFSPPLLAGFYQITGTLKVSTRAREAGTTVNTQAAFVSQNMYRSVTCSEGYLGVKGDGWIVGQNSQFTAYMFAPADRNGCRRAFVVSGTQQEKHLQTTVLFFFSKECNPGFQEVHSWTWQWIGPITKPSPDPWNGDEDPPEDNQPSDPPDPPGWP